MRQVWAIPAVVWMVLAGAAGLQAAVIATPPPTIVTSCIGLLERRNHAALTSHREPP